MVDAGVIQSTRNVSEGLAWTGRSFIKWWLRGPPHTHFSRKVIARSRNHRQSALDCLEQRFPQRNPTSRVACATGSGAYAAERGRVVGPYLAKERRYAEITRHVPDSDFLVRDRMIVLRTSEHHGSLTVSTSTAVSRIPGPLNRHRVSASLSISSVIAWTAASLNVFPDASPPEPISKHSRFAGSGRAKSK